MSTEFSLFKITDTIPRVDLDKTGRPTRWYDVKFETAKGATGTVRVNQKDFTMQKTKDIVRPLAKELDETIGATE